MTMTMMMVQMMLLQLLLLRSAPLTFVLESAARRQLWSFLLSLCLRSRLLQRGPLWLDRRRRGDRATASPPATWSVGSVHSLHLALVVEVCRLFWQPIEKSSWNLVMPGCSLASLQRVGAALGYFSVTAGQNVTTTTAATTTTTLSVMMKKVVATSLHHGLGALPLASYDHAVAR